MTKQLVQLLTLLFTFASSAVQAAVFDTLTGSPGDTVIVSVQGLAPSSVATASIGETQATIASFASDSITLVIPANAKTGLITLRTANGDVWTSPMEFLVLRPLDLLTPNFPHYTIRASLFSQAAGNQVSVATRRPTLVYATSETIAPLVLGIVTDNHTSSFSLSAQTTAEALLFMSPLVYTADPDEAIHRLEVIRSLTAFPTLASIIAQHLGNGTEYLEDNTFLDASAAALQEFLNTEIFADDNKPQRIARSYSMASGYPRDLKVPGFEGIDKIKPELKGGGLRNGDPVWKVTYEPTTTRNDLLKYLQGNPLDWKANLYLLNIDDDRLDLRTKVDAILNGDFTTIYDRLITTPIDSLLIAAKPASSRFDLIGMSANLLLTQVSGTLGNPLGSKIKSELWVPAEEPGLYMVRAFSGARFPPQNALIANLPDGRHEDITMLSLNIVMAAIDAAGLIINAQSAVSESAWAEFIISLHASISQTVSAALAQGPVSASLIFAIAQTAITQLIKSVLSNVVNATLTGLLRNPRSVLVERLGMSLKVMGNVTNRIASTGKLVERLNALTNFLNLRWSNVWAAQSIENTLIVVGDPWAPLIHWVEPRRGYRGDTITIHGEGFHTTPSQNLVTIGYLGTDHANPPQEVRCEVITALPNSLEVRVPDGAQTGVVTVHVPGAGTATSARLKPPHDVFEVIPEIVLHSVQGGTIYPDRVIVITGENFPTQPSQNVYAVLRDANGFDFFPRIRALQPTFALMETGGNHGSFELFFVRNGRESNRLPITIQPFPQRPFGGQIYVSTTEDNNVRDGYISLREAIMLSEGTLDYNSLTRPGAGPSEGPFETDWIAGNGFGNAYYNSILSALPNNSTIVLNAPLPAITTAVNINLGQGPLRVNGNGQPVGLLINGADQVNALYLTLTGFSEAAVRLTGGAQNLYLSLDVDGGSGHGVHLLDSVRNADLYTRVRHVSGDGIRLEGEGVIGNNIHLLEHNEGAWIEDCGGWGISLRNGASANTLLSPPPGIFGQPDSAGIAGCQAGGILITGEGSRGNALDRPPSNGKGIPVFDNHGPGLRIESPETFVRSVSIYGNDGNGIEIVGPAANGTRLVASVIGFDPVQRVAVGNNGHGILISNAQEVQVGWDYHEISAVAGPVQIGGQAHSGIRVENSSRVTLRSLRIGRLEFPSAASPSVLDYYDVPNTLHGIELFNSRSCVIGSNYYDTRVEITNHLSGTGIRIAGSQATDNRVLGSLIGCQAGGFSFNTAVPILSTDFGNKIGIEIAEGAWGNEIGLPGRGRTGNGPGPHNWIYHNREAGIVIDSGGDPSQTTTGDVPFANLGGNVVRNNSLVTQHGVGILLKANARMNLIGDSRGGGNQILGNRIAGIKIEGATASRPDLGNHIQGNYLFNSGFSLPSIPDPFTQEPQAVNILLVNATNQTIGGAHPGLGNTLYRADLGIAVVGGSGNVIQHNVLGSLFHLNPSQTERLKRAGLLLRHTERNLIGPGNVINGTGYPNEPGLAGIVLHTSHANVIGGNAIGTLRDHTPGQNVGDGVLLIESANNQVGGPGPDANIIANSEGYGVAIRGAGSSGNRLAGNYIGFVPMAATPDQPNAQGGVLLSQGASLTQIGGTLPVNLQGALVNLPVSNVIRENKGDGIRVEGPNTLQNTILNNEISGNADLGINLVNGGNANQAAPALTAEPGRLTGTSTAPNGSVVQFFLDPDREGLVFLGQTVVNQGTFTFNLPPFTPPGFVTATVTHALTGNTSPFASPVSVLQPLGALRVRRTIDTPHTRAVLPGEGPVTLLPITLESTEEALVEVTQLTFQHHASTGLLINFRLYLDPDGDGQLNGDEPALDLPVLAQDTTLQVSGEIGVVTSGLPLHLILAATASQNETGNTRVSLETNSAVSAKLVFGGPVTAQGNFPMTGDTVIVRPPINSYAEWQSFWFLESERSLLGQPHQDPDGDGLTNLLEYAMGRHPREAEATPPLTVSYTNGQLRVSFTDAQQPDAVLVLKESTDLRTWTPVPAHEITSEGSSSSGALLRVFSRPSGMTIHHFLSLDIEP